MVKVKKVGVESLSDSDCVEDREFLLTLPAHRPLNTLEAGDIQASIVAQDTPKLRSVQLAKGKPELKEQSLLCRLRRSYRLAEPSLRSWTRPRSVVCDTVTQVLSLFRKADEDADAGQAKGIKGSDAPAWLYTRVAMSAKSIKNRNKADRKRIPRCTLVRWGEGCCPAGSGTLGQPRLVCCALHSL